MLLNFKSHTFKAVFAVVIASAYCFSPAQSEARKDNLVSSLVASDVLISNSADKKKKCSSTFPAPAKEGEAACPEGSQRCQVTKPDGGTYFRECVKQEAGCTASRGACDNVYGGSASVNASVQARIIERLTGVRVNSSNFNPITAEEVRKYNSGTSTKSSINNTLSSM